MKIIQQGFYIHGKLTIWKLQTEVSEYYGAVGFVGKKLWSFVLLWPNLKFIFTSQSEISLTRFDSFLKYVKYAAQESMTCHILFNIHWAHHGDYTYSTYLHVTLSFSSAIFAKLTLNMKKIA